MQDKYFCLWYLILRNISTQTVLSTQKKKKNNTGQSLDTGPMGSRAMLSSCAFLRRLVWVGVGAKNLNEDKLVPAGAIRQKMKPLCTRRFLLHFLLLPPSLSLHPSIAIFSLFSTPFYSLQPSR